MDVFGAVVSGVLGTIVITMVMNIASGMGIWAYV